MQLTVMCLNVPMKIKYPKGSVANEMVETTLNTLPYVQGVFLVQNFKIGVINVWNS